MYLCDSLLAVSNYIGINGTQYLDPQNVEIKLEIRPTTDVKDYWYALNRWGNYDQHACFHANYSCCNQAER